MDAAHLTAKIAELSQQLEQAKAHANALAGALEFAKMLLAEMDAEPTTTSVESSREVSDGCE